MNKLTKLITRPYVDLGFALFCGLNYFLIAFKLVLAYTADGGGFLGFILFPTVVCGMALVILKLIRQWMEQERYKQLNILIVLHFLLFVMNIAVLLEMVLL